jgi:hypothetical protein
MHIHEAVYTFNLCSQCLMYYKGTEQAHFLPLQLSTDVWFVNDIFRTAKLHAALSTVPVYFYQFSFDGELGFMKRIIGASRFPGKSQATQTLNFRNRASYIQGVPRVKVATSGECFLC